jgi:beta-lactamase regulating signal transducer with metallopeptidase domain
MSTLVEILSSPAVIRLGWALLHFIWQGLLIGALLELSLAAIKKASFRYALCACALAAMPLCLLATWRASVETAPSGARLVSVQTEVPFLHQTSPDISRAMPSFLTHLNGIPLHGDLSFGLDRWMPGIVAGWLIGITALATRKTGGFYVLWQLRRQGILNPPEELLKVFRKLCLKLGADPNRVSLKISTMIQVPLAMGWLKPVVLLPAILLSGLTAKELELLLAHELAHIRRHDYLVNILQTVVETVFFYHPAAWWVSRRMRQERENACDDLIVTEPEEVLAYAKVLARLETIRPASSWLASAANGGSLLQRIQRLAGEPSSSTMKSVPALLTLVGIVILLTVLPLAKAQCVALTGSVGKMSETAASTQSVPAIGTDPTRSVPGPAAPLPTSIASAAPAPEDQKAQEQAAFIGAIDRVLPLHLDLKQASFEDAMTVARLAYEKASPGLPMRSILELPGQAPKIDLRLEKGSLREAMTLIAARAGLHVKIAPLHVFYVEDGSGNLALHPRMTKIICSFWTDAHGLYGTGLWSRVLVITDGGLRILHLTPDASGDVRKSLEQCGIQFPSGSSAICKPSPQWPGKNQLTVIETGDQLAEIINLVMAANPESWAPPPSAHQTGVGVH